MAKLKRRVYQLAAVTGCSPDDALLNLRTAGLRVNSVNDLVGEASVDRAIRILRGDEPEPSPRVTESAPPLVNSVGPRSQPSLPQLTSEHPAKKKKEKQPRTRDIQRLSESDVLAIRKRMATTLIAAKDAFGSSKPLWPDRLSMAVERQFTSAGGIFKYKTVAEVTATLAFGIAMSHAFENGNKRTALVALLILLHRNRTLLVNASEDDLYSLITSVVKHELPLPDGEKRDAENEVAAFASWIEEHSREIFLGDRLMRFSELEPILVELGCTFDKPKKNYIKIRCRGYSVVIGRPRRDWEIDAQEVKRIRKTLHLDELHGLDSAGFYNLDGQVDGFVNQYRQLMDRLADQ